MSLDPTAQPRLRGRRWPYLIALLVVATLAGGGVAAWMLTGGDERQLSQPPAGVAPSTVAPASTSAAPSPIGPEATCKQLMPAMRTLVPLATAMADNKPLDASQVAQVKQVRDVLRILSDTAPATWQGDVAVLLNGAALISAGQLPPDRDRFGRAGLTLTQACGPYYRG